MKMMKNATSVEVKIGDKVLSLETGALARQAASAVVASIGETFLFCAVSTSKAREGIDFFPMQVEYKEKFYAAGRFPGGFFKREARPSEKEILIMRVTDRPIRPLFPEGYRNELQINMMLMSSDGTQEVDAMAINAASAALTISEVPFQGPIGAVRVGRINGQFILEPSQAQILESDLDLTYAGTRDKLLMMEGEAKEISDEDMVAALKFAHEAIIPIIDAQLELRRALGLPDKVIAEIPVNAELMDSAKALKGAELAEALTIAGKLERQDKVAALREELKGLMKEKHEDLTDEEFFHLFDALEIALVRDNVLNHGKRIDGRKADEMRPLSGDTGLLPRTHGSAVFQRGETQAVAIITLGTGSDTQAMDGVTGGPREKNFMLHYNFPPYSVGEAGRLGMTSRREIGHGNLAERSLKNVIPADFPYTVRVVSEVMSSNGSTSMASTCSGTLALMDAGVPITAPVAGISVGLFSGNGKNVLVLDILGSEDHCGDMDFKVCGTRKGITGFQVDLKIPGLGWDLVEQALTETRDARLKILDFMESVIASPREEMSPHAPRIELVNIPPDKIGELIGPGGKNIRGITEASGAQIDIAEDGTVSIFATSAESMELAKKHVLMVAAEPEEGVLYEGTVTGVKEFGAFVEIFPGRDGLCHISELSDQRVRSVEDVCRVGDRMWVKCLAVDDRGRIKLSRREAMRELAERNEDRPAEPDA